MNYKIKNPLIKLLVIIFVFTFLAGISVMLPAKAASAEENGGNMSAVMLNEQQYQPYLNGIYKTAYGVSDTDIDIANCSTDGGVRGSYNLNNIFDGNINSFWISQNAVTAQAKINVTVKFKSVKTVYNILYGCSYYSRSNVRNFSGYPSVLNVYTAKGDEEFKLAGTCISTPAQNTEFVLFSLPEAVKCDKIKVEFTEVITYSGVFGGADVAAASDMAFYTVPENVNLNAPIMAEGDYDNEDFLVHNSVSNKFLTARANGGGDIASAFDGNRKTYWSSENYNTDIFKNKVTVVFDSPVELESIVYACSYYTAGGRRNYSGFPKVFKIYTSEDGSDTTLTAMFAGTPTSNWDKARYVFDRTVICKKLVLEFNEVTTYANVQNGAPIAVAGEIFLVQPINEDMAEILNIFADYARFELKPEYRNAEKLNELREKAVLSGNYLTTYKPILDRAEAINSGAIRKDPHREFSTLNGSRNEIIQVGDMVNYCRGGGLKLANYGTNQQLTGIGGATGETITIFVDADEGTKLPQILFTQIYGAWNSWKAVVNLKPGKNVFTFPNIKANGGYSVPIGAGGPIHILNPYTEETQGGDVTLYIDGGCLYPVFKDGDDEETFRMILKDYYEKLTDPENTAVTVDAFECASNYFIGSTRATQAYQQYVVNGISPQKNLDKWNAWLKGLLAYGGVQFDSSGEFYDERNNYVSVNIRAVQPYAGMFAFAWTDHVGLPDGGMQTHLINKGSAGWAMGHEVGHMLDIGERKVGETTNNMWAIFDIYMMDGNINDRINVTNVARNLASDFSPKVGQFWGNGSNNCDIWWIIEGAHPGYWGNSENMYRYEQTGKTLGKTEKFVYYGSLATGEDMSGYFERWGFYQGDAFTAENRFTYAKSSQEFKDLMTAAKASGRISGNGKKFWYVNNDQYRYERERGLSVDASWASCYTAEDKINITPDKIMKSANGYTFILPTISHSTAHLCYEIQVKQGGVWKVAGITYSTVFTDSNNYGNTSPEFRFYAYDRMFNCTGDGSSVVPDSATQTGVCRIGDNFYDSLGQAIAAAQNNDTVYLLKDFHDGGITVNKPLTIAVDESVAADSVKITKNTDGNMFNVIANGGGYTFNLGVAGSSKKIILDGGSFYQSGTLLRTSGGNYMTVATRATNVILQNNYTTGNGGGAYVGYCGQIYLINCTVRNNKACDGAGVFLEGSNPGYGASQFAPYNVIIENNIASGNGGGIYSSRINGTNFVLNGTANNDPEYSKVLIRNNSAKNGGGIFADNRVDLRFLCLIDNRAQEKGGGMYIVRENITLNLATVSGNTAGDGQSSAVYLENPQNFLLKGGVFEGGIFRNFTGVFKISDSMPDFSNATFYLPPIPADGATFINNIGGFTATEESINGINIENGLTRPDGDTVKVVRNLAEVTLIFDGRVEVIQIPLGEFIFPEHVDVMPETKYIVKWSTGGNDYAAGDSILITGNCTFNLTTGDYFVLSLVYPDHTETVYVADGNIYYLPMKTAEGNVIFGWEDAAGNYYAYADGIVITRNTVLTAVIKVRLKVTFDVGGELTEYFYDIGETVMLPALEGVDGKIFKHWLIDGIKYKAGSSVTVDSNLIAVAEFTEKWRVTTVIDDSETVAYYEHNSLIVLPAPEDAMGRVFKNWLVDGVKYYAGAEYVVKCDTEVVAVFVQTSGDAQITVSLIFNSGADGSGEIVENERIDLTVAFLDSVTLPEPPVNDGYVFRYWLINGSRYAAGDKITVTEAFTANAVIIPVEEVENEEIYYTVTVVTFEDGKELVSKRKYGKGEKHYLKQPVYVPEGKLFSHWLVGDESYEAGQYVEITGDVTVKAVYKNIPTPEKPDIPEGGNDANNGNGVNVGLIVGIIVAILVVAGGAAAAIIIITRRKSDS